VDIFCWRQISPYTSFSTREKMKRNLTKQLLLFIYYTILYIYIYSIELGNVFIVFANGFFCLMHMFIQSLYMACHPGWEKPALHLSQNKKEVGVDWVHVFQSVSKGSCTLFWQKCHTYTWRLSCAIVGCSSFFLIASLVSLVIWLKKKQPSHHCFSMQLWYGQSWSPAISKASFAVNPNQTINHTCDSVGSKYLQVFGYCLISCHAVQYFAMTAWYLLLPETWVGKVVANTTLHSLFAVSFSLILFFIITCSC